MQGLVDCFLRTYLPATALLVLGTATAVAAGPPSGPRQMALFLLGVGTMVMSRWAADLVRDKELLKLRVEELEEENASLNEENTALLKTQMAVLDVDAEAGPQPPAQAQPHQVRYHAHFNPEAWVDDDAVSVDPLGPCGWDCTTFIHNHDLTEHVNKAYDSAFEHWLDEHDLLKDDPAAPAWVRDWDGPFTITVERI